MKVEMWPIGDVKPYGKNPRRISDVAVEKVAGSITAFGFKQPIVVDKDGVIITGHTRLRAAQKLGLTEVPVIVASDLSDEKVRAYRIADNKTAEFTFWDDSLLKDELELLKALEFDMSSLAFSDKELVKALSGTSVPQTGAQELNVDDFQRFEHKCPRCGFEYDKDAEQGKDVPA